jgi:hypothetical protein
MQKCWTKVPSVLFFEEIRWTKLDKIVILPYFPYNTKAKLRLEVLFKKLHTRINLTTLFLTKLYLLSTIKPFSGFLDKISKNLYKGGTLRNLNFKVLSMQDIKLAPMRLGANISAL